MVFLMVSVDPSRKRGSCEESMASWWEVVVSWKSGLEVCWIAHQTACCRYPRETDAGTEPGALSLQTSPGAALRNMCDLLLLLVIVSRDLESELNERTLLEMQLVVRGALCLGRRRWGAIVMEQVVAGLQVLSSAVRNKSGVAVSLRPEYPVAE